jgi:dipeptidyl aminopeptidase/acylaminoacyl peptidase
VRDKLQYNDEVQLLANRGYAVLQPNFRGSGGYGEAFEEKGNGQIGRGMQDDIDDAMDWAVEQGIADAGRVCVVGGSYGGYAAIWSVIRNPERYRCAASWAGVTDWDRMLRYDRKFFSRGKYYREWSRTVRGEDVKNLKDVSPYRAAEQLNRPLLLAHGTKDNVVPFKQYTQFEKASRKAPVKPTTLVIKDEGHSFSKPENEKAWYDALEGFLMKHNPPDAAVAVGAVSNTDSK